MTVEAIATQFPDTATLDDMGRDAVVANLDASEVALLQACVGFHAKAQSDPGIRDRLYRLWCKLDALKQQA